jgi:hypothetical protein
MCEFIDVDIIVKGNGKGCRYTKNGFIVDAGNTVISIARVHENGVAS